MSEGIPFDRRFDLTPGQVEEVTPGVRRLLADNPSPFTYKGTVSYIIGRGKVAVIDPGPADQRHVAALLAAVRGETVTHIVVTHTHRDHSLAVAAVKTATGATVISEGPHRLARVLHSGEAERLEAGADLEFRPDQTIGDGECLAGSGWSLEAIATPGHTANHMAFAYPEAGVVFVGDHVMAWSTSIIAPPDGAMRDYMASLRKIRRRPESLYFPGHGPPVRDAPAFVNHYIRHRERREASILRRLASGPAGIPAIVRSVYIGIDPRLAGAAALSVLAHLEDLVERGMVTTDGMPSIGGTYRRAGE